MLRPAWVLVESPNLTDSRHGVEKTYRLATGLLKRWMNLYDGELCKTSTCIPMWDYSHLWLFRFRGERRANRFMKAIHLHTERMSPRPLLASRTFKKTPPSAPCGASREGVGHPNVQ